MKLSDWKGEEAIDLLADLLDPVMQIVTDKELKEKREAKATRGELLKTALKGHKKEIITILALINGEDPEEYEPSLIELPGMVMEMLNDEALMKLFQSQDQTSPEESSGPVTGNTEEDDQ